MQRRTSARVVLGVSSVSEERACDEAVGGNRREGNSLEGVLALAPGVRLGVRILHHALLEKAEGGTGRDEEEGRVEDGETSQRRRRRPRLYPLYYE